MGAAFQPPHIYEAIEVDDSLRINSVRPIMTRAIELVNLLVYAAEGQPGPLAMSGGA
jgi:hypothetical protein